MSHQVQSHLWNDRRDWYAVVEVQDRPNFRVWLRFAHGVEATLSELLLGMTYRHTKEQPMPKTKVAVTLDEELLEELDRLVARRQFPNRSQAIEVALREKLSRLARTRLAEESSKLDPDEERALAEEGLDAERTSWPEY